MEGTGKLLGVHVLADQATRISPWARDSSSLRSPSRGTSRGFPVARRSLSQPGPAVLGLPGESPAFSWGGVAEPFRSSSASAPPSTSRSPPALPTRACPCFTRRACGLSSAAPPVHGLPYGPEPFLASCVLPCRGMSRAGARSVSAIRVRHGRRRVPPGEGGWRASQTRPRDLEGRGEQNRG